MDNSKEVATIPLITSPELDDGQSRRLTAVVSLVELLRRITGVLEGISVTVIQSEAGCDRDVGILESVEWTALKTKEVLCKIAEHHEKCAHILEQQIQISKNMVSVLNACKNVPSDEFLKKRLTELNEILNQFEKHRASGLLEIITKL